MTPILHERMENRYHQQAKHLPQSVSRWAKSLLYWSPTLVRVKSSRTQPATEHNWMKEYNYKLQCFLRLRKEQGAFLRIVNILDILVSHARARQNEGRIHHSVVDILESKHQVWRIR